MLGAIVEGVGLEQVTSHDRYLQLKNQQRQHLSNMKTNTLERNAKIYRDRIAEFGYGHPNYDPMHLRNNVPSPIRIGDVCTLTLNDGLQRVFSTTSPHDSEINSEELPPVPPFPVFSLDLQQECQSRVRQFPLFSKAAKGKEGSTSVFAGVPK